MSQYYFFVASLPTLSLTSDRRPSTPAFLAHCRGNISERDFQLLSRALIDPPQQLVTESSLLTEWTAFEMGLRNELARQRAGNRGVDPAEDIRHDRTGETHTGRVGLSELVREAQNQATPLATEEFLIRARWRVLDDLETGHYFDSERVLVYYLKLQLLERRSAFTKNAGEERFTQLTEGILNAYYQEQSAI